MILRNYMGYAVYISQLTIHTIGRYVQEMTRTSMVRAEPLYQNIRRSVREMDACHL